MIFYEIQFSKLAVFIMIWDDMTKAEISEFANNAEI